MTHKEIAEMIESIGVPYAYYQFPENTKQKTPFICFYYPYIDGFYADNKVYAKKTSLIIELYTDNKDFDLEETVENILNEHELPFYKTESYIDTEKMLMQTYEMEVFING